MEADRSRKSPDRPYIHYQRAGEKALQEKRFEPAKCALDQAYSQASHDPSTTPLTLISILDLRIESLLKLRDLDAAGIDARKMVRHDRGDPRGYLRCGQMGRLKNDFAEAQNWYQQGLKKVPQTNENYDKLESMRAKLIYTIAAQQSKLRDPLTVLPMDLIHMVFHFLELWEATSCLRVSKTWRNTLLATHSIWKTLDLLGAKRNISLRHLKACLRRMPSPPTTVRLKKLTYSAETYLQPYIERWKAIEHLSVNRPGLFQLSCTSGISTAIKSLHVGEHCPIYFKVVDDLLHCCDRLKSARFDAVLKGLSSDKHSPFIVQYHGSAHRKTTLPELNDLVLTATFKYYELDRFIDPLGLCCDFPNLTKLHCSGFAFKQSEGDFSVAQCLLDLSLEGVRVEHNFKLPRSLEVLTCKETTFPLRPFSELLSLSDQRSADWEALPNLRNLRMDVSAPSSGIFKMIEVSPSATLTRLDISCGDHGLSQLMILLELGKLSRLAFLSIAHTNLTDSHVERIAAACPTLEQVELSALRITGVAVKELCTRTAIKTLKVRECHDISADAIEWARARGITVTAQMSGQQATGGRKIRYG